VKAKDELQKALARLYKRQNFGIKMGLDIEQALLEKLGNPEQAFAAIHVAGTNGKGSVCAILDSILRAAGLKVGLYTSPHLVRFNERITVNGIEVTDAELWTLFEKVEPIVAEVAQIAGREPTFFECTTAMAFEHFRQKGIQMAVLETGLGGRLDATNVVTPVLSVITPISLEHTKYLGPDIESIAGEKCGIIKPGRPVVAAGMVEEALGVIRNVARERGCALVEAAGAVNVRLISADLKGQKVHVESGNASYGALNLPLLGTHQLGNLATAVAAIEALNDAAGLGIAEAPVKKGVAATKWPGRFQVLQEDPPMILDGAHNPGGAVALTDTLKQVFKNKPVALVFGMCDDKDIGNYLKPFGRVVKRMWAVPLKTERSLPVERVSAAGKAMGWPVVESTVREAMTESLVWAKQNGGVVCMAGSLFLVGEVLELEVRKS